MSIVGGTYNRLKDSNTTRSSVSVDPVTKKFLETIKNPVSDVDRSRTSPYLQDIYLIKLEIRISETLAKLSVSLKLALQ